MPQPFARFRTAVTFVSRAAQGRTMG